MQGFVPSLFLGGTDLTAEERAKHGLTEKQVAFRLGTPLGSRAKAAGFQAGDVVLGVEGQALEGLDDTGFFYWLQSHYLVGDVVAFDVIRDGQRQTHKVTLR